MIYNNIEQAIFKERPNRFIAYVETKNGIEICHVKNTGRCKELLVKDATVYVQRNNSPTRKTPLDLICVKKDDRLINMDSQVPNKVVIEWLKESGFCSKNAMIKPEKVYENSRFDVYIEDGDRKIFIEVKGVTLEEDGVVKFPDAPTVRGVKHINELLKCVEDGYEAYIFFVIQMENVKFFTPNDETQKEFGDTLRIAHKSGVNILCYDCKVTPEEIKINKEVPVKL